MKCWCPTNARTHFFYSYFVTEWLSTCIFKMLQLHRLVKSFSISADSTVHQGGKKIPLLPCFGYLRLSEVWKWQYPITILCSFQHRFPQRLIVTLSITHFRKSRRAMMGGEIHQTDQLFLNITPYQTFNVFTSVEVTSVPIVWCSHKPPWSGGNFNT